MAEKLNPKQVALTLGIVFAAVSLACALLVAIAPEVAMSLFSNVFHGIDITQIAAINLSFVGIFFGIIEAFVFGLLVGWLFAAIYNKLR